MKKARSKVENIDCVGEILELFGPPALLSSEKIEDYTRLLRKLVQAVKPADAIEMILTEEVANHFMEIRRLRLVKVGVIEDARETAPGAEDDAISPQMDARFFVSRDLERYERLSRLQCSAEERLQQKLILIESRRAILAERLRRAAWDAIRPQYGASQTPNEVPDSTRECEQRGNSNLPRIMPGPRPTLSRKAG